MSGLSNVDTSTLETLKQFKVFFEMVQNPKSFVKIIEDADNVVKEMQKTVEAFTTVELANEYLTKAKAFANEKTAEIEAKTQAAQEAASKREAQIQASRVEAQAVIDKANELMKKAEAQQKDLTIFSEVLEARRIELNNFANELGQREANLQVQEKELLEKANKLKSIMGI